jgi:hypothetical protein
MALIARVSSASHFRPFLSTLVFFFFFFFLRLPNYAFFFSFIVVVVFVVVAALVPPSFPFHRGYFFSPFTSGRYRIAHLSLAPACLSFLPYQHINFSLPSAAITSHFVSIPHIVANGVAKGVISSLCNEDGVG